MNESRQPDETIFEGAVKLAPDQRAAYLKEACGNDAQLRQRVERLLQAHDQTSGVLEEPPAAVSAKTFVITTAMIPVTEKAGDRIGRYKLRENLGEGGCGVVYVAEQEEPVRRRVALKVIKLGMDTKQVVARFEAERQALAMMDHPNIAKVLDAGSTETGRPYFVMELVRGIRITDYCDQNNLPTQERLDLFIKVCQAIQHAHQKGIIHRDIKPSNILVTLHDGVPVPKVIDFGIAKATEGRLTDATVYTQLHQFIGTPAYMSPEQAEMSGLDIDTRSDIYSLGVLLYELLAGSTPFDAKELMSLGIDAMRKAIREKEPVRPSTKLTQELVAADVSPRKSTSGLAIPTAEEISADSRRRLRLKEQIARVKGDLDWIVMKCLEKDRTRRYETANGLAADLKRHLNNEPVVARPPSRTYKIQKFARRNKIAFAAVACVTVALVAGLGLAMIGLVQARIQRNQAFAAHQRADEFGRLAEEQRRRAEEGKQRAEQSELAARQRAYASDINLAQQSLLNDNVGRALELLSRQRPAKNSEIDLRGWEWRYLWQQCQSDALPGLLQVSNRVRGLTVSPDGKWLAAPSAAESGGLTIFDVSDLSKPRLVEKLAVGDAAIRAAFSQQQSLLAFSSVTHIPGLNNDKYSLHLWNPRTRQMLAEVPMSGACGYLEFSPDGEKLLTYAAYPKAAMALWRAPSLERIAVEPAIQAALTETEIHGLAVTRDWAYAAFLSNVSEDSTYQLRVIDWVTGKPRWSTQVNGGPELQFSPDGKLLFLSEGMAGSPKVRILDALAGREIGPGLTGHREWVGDLVFWPDGKTLATSSADRTIRLWNLADPAHPQAIGSPLKGHKSEVWGLTLLPDQRTLISVGKDGVFLIWDTQKARPDQTRLTIQLTGSTGWRFAPDSKSIITTERNGQVTQWSGPNFETRDVLVNVSNGLDMVVSRDCRWLATGSTNGMVQLWDLGKRTLVKKFSAGSGRVPPFEFRKGGKKLITWSEEHLSKEWDLVELKELASWQDFEGPSLLSPDERWYFTMSWKGDRLLVHDMATGVQTVQTNLDFNVENPTGLAVSPDTKTLAVGSEAGFARLFDRESLQPIDTLRGFLLDAVFSVCFSPDGKRLATTSGGREAMKLWDVTQRQELLHLECTGQGLFGDAQFSPDGNILGAFTDSTLHLWRAPSWEEINAAEAKEKAENKQP